MKLTDVEILRSYSYRTPGDADPYEWQLCDSCGQNPQLRGGGHRWDRIKGLGPVTIELCDACDARVRRPQMPYVEP